MKYFLNLFCGVLYLLEIASANAGPGTIIKFLSGTSKDDHVMWDFYCTGGMQKDQWKKIAVPSCWELQGFGIYNYGTRFRGKNATEDVTTRPGFAAEQGKYKLEFNVPSEWKGKVVRIVFEGVMVKTEVWVNGISAGTPHEGSFYEFKYDITPLLKMGKKNLLEVTVSKLADNWSIMRAERQGDFWNFGGIFRPVFLEVMPTNYIDWSGIDAKANGDFKADLHLSPGAGTEVSAQVLDAASKPVGAPFTAKVANEVTDTNLTGARVQAHFDGIKSWTAETPNLYQVRFTLLQDGVTKHVITNRFAFRTFELRTNDGMYLNGQKIILKGVNRHSLWADSGRTLSRELCFEDARLIKGMNMNAVRMSHYPPDRDFLEACDEMGLYVLDELTGWQGSYDTQSGQRLVGEMVRRDVNHPSILIWDNGNEGGWNNALDVEFGKWDIQKRNVMHPWAKDRGADDPHYPDYAGVVRDSGGPAIYFTTEFLHGLYDGGLGSGFHDFWEAMRNSPVLGGAFFWVFSDDGVVRTDKGGIIDNTGDQGPDGILGPRHEKEGSYNTIREIWSPVEIQAPPGGLSPGFKGAITVMNHYDFTDLGQCKFLWEYVRFPGPKDGHAGHTVLASGELSAPSAPPHGSGELNLALPLSQKADAVYLTAKNPAGQVLWTWSWPVARVNAETLHKGKFKLTTKETPDQLIVNRAGLELCFDKKTGFLTTVHSDGKTVSFGNGPRFIAFTHDRPAGRSRTTNYRDVAGTNSLSSLSSHMDGEDVIVEANYEGTFKQASWRISTDGGVKLNYTYEYSGPVDLLGVNFDYPETSMKGITWLGDGPYRVWQNRLQGTYLDVWENKYNDTIPSVVYSTSPEFKGFFGKWKWASFDTKEGRISVRTEKPDSYLGVYTPKDGPVGPLLALPQTGLTFLDVIPAMRDKFLSQERMGPQSAQKQVSGIHEGELSFDFHQK